MPTINSAWIYVDLGITVQATDVGAVVRVAPAPVAGTIKKVIVGMNTLLTTGGGTLAVAKGSTNILSSTTYSLASAASPDLVAATPEEATLSASATALKVAALDQLKATWTLTTATIGYGGTCVVVIEPDYW